MKYFLSEYLIFSNFKMLINLKRLINRFNILLRHDAFRESSYQVSFRLLELIILLLRNKKSIFRINAKNGSFRFIFKPYKGSGYGGRGQFLYRENYDRFFKTDLSIFKRDFKTFIDVGASRGFFSTYMSSSFGCKTVSIDLYPYAINDCEENLKLNNIYDGIFKVSAIGSNLDIGKFICLDKTDVPSRTSVLKAKIKSTDSNNSFIKMSSIDEIVKEYNFLSVDMIKIDVEGYEKNVLYGALNTIEKFRPLIYLEFKESKLDILKFAKSQNYLSYLPSIQGKLIPINEIEINENAYENIFLIPNENNLRF